MSQTTSGSSQEDAPIKYVCGIDVGSQSCSGCVCRPDKSVVVKPVTFANAKEGWEVLFEKLTRLDAVPKQILIGMEATSLYGENLYQEAQARGYQLCLLHPGQTHQFHRQQGLRAKTDRLDAKTIAKVLLSGEARAGRMRAKELSHRQQQGQVPTSTGKIGDATCVVTMDAPRLPSTQWTKRRGRA